MQVQLKTKLQLNPLLQIPIFNEFLIQENKLIATIPFNEQH